MNRSRFLFATMVSAIPVGMFLLVYLITPGYLIPFLHNPAGLGCIILLAIWVAIGFVLLLLSDKVWPRIVVGIFVAAPTLLLLMLGPAIVTIVQALGPVMQDQDANSTSGSSGADSSSSSQSSSTKESQTNETQQSESQGKGAEGSSK